MRRAAFVLFAVLLVGLALLRGGSTAQPHFTVELDNAFGIIPAGDVMVAGVRAGTVTGVRLERPSYRALVDVRVDASGYGTFHRDARCSVRLRSLLGEYFLDCDPGTPGQPRLPYGERISVTRTQSTVPPDLVLSISQLPYRERLRIIVSELGAGAAANAQSLNSALARAVPALTETDAVLRTLARQRQALSRLLTNAHAVLAELAGRRSDVTRFVVRARDTTAIAATRRAQLASSLQRLPGFLRQLTPAMGELQSIADSGIPVARNLDASAGQIDQLLGNVTSVSSAARPALVHLGRATGRGQAALRLTEPQTSQLMRFAAGLPELSQNLAIVAQALDDPNKALEQNPLSPGLRGFTAVQNLFNFIYNQALAINVYDGENHILKAGIVVNDCSPYENSVTAKARLTHTKRCASWLGPNQPGVTTPDLTAPSSGAQPPSRQGGGASTGPSQTASRLLGYLLSR